jgi:hypothetical protein
MKMIATTITAISFAALSASAIAAEQLSASQLDGVTAGYGIASGVADAVAWGLNSGTHTVALSSAGELHAASIASSQSSQTGGFGSASVANAGGGAVGLLGSSDSYSLTYARPGYAAGEATSTNFAFGPSLSISHSGTASSSIGAP